MLKRLISEAWQAIILSSLVACSYVWFYHKFWFFNFHIPQNETTSGADLEGAQAARAPSIFCRDRAPDFVWAPQHRILNTYFEILCTPRKKNAPHRANCLWKLQFFSASQGAHPPQTPPIPTGAKVLSVFDLGAPSFKKSWIRPWISTMSVFQNFSAKSHPVFSTILLWQFGPKTSSGRIALCAFLHRRKLVEIEHFCIFSMQKRPSFYIRCCKIPVYRFYSKCAPILSQI